MRIIHSNDLETASVPALSPVLIEGFKRISQEQLREWVQSISEPRHFHSEPAQNRAVARWISNILSSMGYSVERQGPSSNIIAFPGTRPKRAILVGAHYDSVPGSPGADDNASAVAAMLACASVLANCGPRLPVIFAAFNREEDGFIGSREFVIEHRAGVACAHILEMVGYASNAPGSQRLPTGLPIRLSDRGDFLGLLANEPSAPAMQLVMKQSRAATPELPVTGLQVVPGAERVFPVLARSDHVPFWEAGIPAVMWTDTAEFRNPHYHQPTDTPDTLDYQFLQRVCRVLSAAVFVQASDLS